MEKWFFPTTHKYLPRLKDIILPEYRKKKVCTLYGKRELWKQYDVLPAGGIKYSYQTGLEEIFYAKFSLDCVASRDVPLTCRKKDFFNGGNYIEAIEWRFQAGLRSVYVYKYEKSWTLKSVFLARILYLKTAVDSGVAHESFARFIWNTRALVCLFWTLEHFFLLVK